MSIRYQNSDTVQILPLPPHSIALLSSNAIQSISASTGDMLWFWSMADNSLSISNHQKNENIHWYSLTTEKNTLIAHGVTHTQASQGGHHTIHKVCRLEWSQGSSAPSKGICKSIKSPVNVQGSLSRNIRVVTYGGTNQLYILGSSAFVSSIYGELNDISTELNGVLPADWTPSSLTYHEVTGSSGSLLKVEHPSKGSVIISINTAPWTQLRACTGHCLYSAAPAEDSLVLVEVASTSASISSRTSRPVVSQPTSGLESKISAWTYVSKVSTSPVALQPLGNPTPIGSDFLAAHGLVSAVTPRAYQLAGKTIIIK